MHKRSKEVLCKLDEIKPLSRSTTVGSVLHLLEKGKCFYVWVMLCLQISTEIITEKI